MWIRRLAISLASDATIAFSAGGTAVFSISWACLVSSASLCLSSSAKNSSRISSLRKGPFSAFKIACSDSDGSETNLSIVSRVPSSSLVRMWKTDSLSTAAFRSNSTKFFRITVTSPCLDASSYEYSVLPLCFSDFCFSSSICTTFFASLVCRGCDDNWFTSIGNNTRFQIARSSISPWNALLEAPINSDREPEYSALLLTPAIGTSPINRLSIKTLPEPSRSDVNTTWCHWLFVNMGNWSLDGLISTAWAPS